MSRSSNPVRSSARDREQDAVEALDLPQPPQRIAQRPAPLQPRVDGHPLVLRLQLDRLEHRQGQLDLLPERRVERERERDHDQVGRDEHGTVGAGDPERRGEHGRVELAAREGYEQPRRTGAGLGGPSAP